MVEERFNAEEPAQRVAAWTEQEIEVLRSLAPGTPASVVAEQRLTTVAEVGALLSSARAKAGVTSTRAAVELARRAGLLD